MKLKVSIGLFAAIVLLCMCYISSYHHFYGDTIQKAKEPGNAPQALIGQILAEEETGGSSKPASAKARADSASDTGCVYWLALEEGVLTVYEADKKTLLERTDITPRNLTVEQEKKYAEGIKVCGIHQFYSALKEFSGEE